MDKHESLVEKIERDFSDEFLEANKSTFKPGAYEVLKEHYRVTLKNGKRYSIEPVSTMMPGLWLFRVESEGIEVKVSLGEGLSGVVESLKELRDVLNAYLKEKGK